MVRGSCLCGVVRFEIERAVGPFELCHCNRCRKYSGSAFAAMVGVSAKDFRFIQGRELIASYEAPILRTPSPYRVSFCTRCGSPVPDPQPGETWFEIPAGSLDGDLGLNPDKHIFVEHRPDWDGDVDQLPQLTMQELVEWRRKNPRSTPD